MRLTVPSLDIDIAFDAGCPSCLQIEDPATYRRVIESLLSQNGSEALEPYYLYENETELKNLKKLKVFTDAFSNPLLDQKLLSKLYKRVEREILSDEKLSIEVSTLLCSLQDKISSVLFMFNGNYEFFQNSDILPFCKAYQLLPSDKMNQKLIDNWIKYFNLTIDIEEICPIVFVGFENIFSKNELTRLISEINDLNLEVLFLNQTSSKVAASFADYMYIDQQFIEDFENGNQLAPRPIVGDECSEWF